MIKRLGFCVLLVIGSLCSSVSANTPPPATTPIGQQLQVFPGDRFYVEGEQVDVPVVTIAAPFEGRMPGSMRIPFSFAIDSTELRWSKDRDGWRYFAAPEGAGRAWHSMLGDVLAAGDTVGIRIRAKDGLREWFVDNSRYNRMNTIWHRKVGGKDPAVASDKTVRMIRAGSQLRSLEYMGSRDKQIRVRYREIGAVSKEDEFLFPIEPQLPMLIGVMGLRAEVSEITGTSAKIKVLRGFDADGFAQPAQ